MNLACLRLGAVEPLALCWVRLQDDGELLGLEIKKQKHFTNMIYPIFCSLSLSFSFSFLIPQTLSRLSHKDTDQHR